MPNASRRFPARDGPARGIRQQGRHRGSARDSRQSLYDILSEKQPVTLGMAVRLGIVFDTSSASWLRMQTAYDLWHAERDIDTSKLQPLPKAG
jgi:hypothetical protein